MHQYTDYMGPVKRICVFEHSVMTNFNCVCPAIQRGQVFCLKVPLDSLLVWASSEGSGETARMRRLAWTFAARIGDKYQICLTQSICGMNTSRPACTGSTAEASKVRKNHTFFTFKKFILPHCLDSATPPRPNEREPNSHAVKMHRKEERKRRGKGKRKEEKIRDQKKKKRKEVVAPRLFCGDPSTMAFHELN